MLILNISVSCVVLSVNTINLILRPLGYIWKGVSATLQSGRYTLSYPRGHWCIKTPENFLVWGVFHLLKWVMRSEIWWKNKRGVIFKQRHESFIDHFFLTLRSHSSVHIQTTTIVSSFMFLFTLMGILIAFMGNNTPKIFCRLVFAVLTCVFYTYIHAIWSTDA